MIRAFAALAVVLLGVAAPASLMAQERSDTAATREQLAQKAAEAWLPLIEGGKYQESWQRAAKQFQQAVTAELWTQQAAAVVAQVGALKSRELENAQYSAELPNAPPGEYVVLTYASAFANVPRAREVVVTVLEEGEWRVVGYFVGPAGS
jgi:menaquinone-dependent protoporphyrinogen IX oxidase